MEIAAAMILAVILTTISSQSSHEEDKDRAVETHREMVEARDEADRY